MDWYEEESQDEDQPQNPEEAWAFSLFNRRGVPKAINDLLAKKRKGERISYELTLHVSEIPSEIVTILRNDYMGILEIKDFTLEGKPSVEVTWDIPIQFVKVILEETKV